MKYRRHITMSGLPDTIPKIILAIGRYLFILKFNFSINYDLNHNNLFYTDYGWITMNRYRYILT